MTAPIYLRSKSGSHGFYETWFHIEMLVCAAIVLLAMAWTLVRLGASERRLAGARPVQHELRRIDAEQTLDARHVGARDGVHDVQIDARLHGVAAAGHQQQCQRASHVSCQSRVRSSQATE